MGKRRSRRSNWANLFPCPICGKKPHIKIFPINSGTAYCKGFGFHRHKTIMIVASHEQPSKLYETILNSWNQTHFKEARFLFDINGSPFRSKREEAINIIAECIYCKKRRKDGECIGKEGCFEAKKMAMEALAKAKESEE